MFLQLLNYLLALLHDLILQLLKLQHSWVVELCFNSLKLPNSLPAFVSLLFDRLINLENLLDFIIVSEVRFLKLIRVILHTELLQTLCCGLYLTELITYSDCLRPQIRSVLQVTVWYEFLLLLLHMSIHKLFNIISLFDFLLLKLLLKLIQLANQLLQLLLIILKHF